MSRSVSLTMRSAINAEQTSEVPIALITITHPDIDDPIRISSDPSTRISVDPLVYGTVSRGDTFNFWPGAVQLPEENEDAAPAMRLMLDNISREAIPLLRSVSTPATVTVELVLASDPDTVEASWPEFDLVGANYDAGQLSLDLTINALANEPYPSGTFTPSGFGGLF